ncbi:calcium-binding protein [Patulibacter defluvii]|uniref:calcium-binding protein n=1 Tax=Patulibacter defluvii TaxID=3095358 RepID=UPI002A76104E|nr:PASTA domain-containing protein [Patulibacter sp. DM4]
MRRSSLLLPIAVLAGALLPTASAGAAQVVRDGSTIVLRAGPGEANHVAVRGDAFDEQAIEFSDVVPPTVGDGLTCSETSAMGWYFVSCKAAGLSGIQIETGDGDDVVAVGEQIPVGGPLTIDGGPGNDKLTGPTGDRAVALNGGDGNDALEGGAGPDVLHGGGGDDELDGSGGDDQVHGDAGDDDLAGGRFLSSDLLDGGPGVDSITQDWFDSNGPTLPIAVTIDGNADDGRPNERDNVIGVERIVTRQVARLVAGRDPVVFDVNGTGAGGTTLIGSPGPDRLRSFDYDDVIEGGAGNDSIEAGNGDDRIVPGPGQDTVLADAGPGSCNFAECRGQYGNDVIDARDGERDSIDCGNGNDRVIADPIDVLSNCETVERGSGGGNGGPSGDGGSGGSAKRCTVPKVKAGSTVTSARKRLKKAGCKVGKTRRAASRTRKGRVVKLSPGAGKKTTKAVTIVVSRGRR